MGNTMQRQLIQAIERYLQSLEDEEEKDYCA